MSVGGRFLGSRRGGDPLATPWRTPDDPLTTSFWPPCTYTLHVYDIFTGLTRRRSAADLGATPSFHRLLNRPVTLGDTLGPLGDPLGPLGDPLRSLELPWTQLGIPQGCLVEFLETFGVVLGSLGDALASSLGPLRSSFGHFRCLLGIL